MAKKKLASLPRTKCQHFAESFSDEAELRQALITLLERLPGHTQIRHTHGANERGKDVVFYVEAPFGRTELCACVVKNGPITGSADSDKGARNVYNQAEQCFDTPIISTQGVAETVAQVWVITPFECDDHAMASISGKLAKSSRIRFLFGEELFGLFEDRYPEYLLYKSGLFSSYVADLERGISNDNAVANVLIRHGVGGAADRAKEIYIHPSLSVSLTTFQLVLMQPKPGRLLEAFTEAELTNFISTIRYIVRAVTFWSNDEVETQLARDLTEFTKLVRVHWQRSFESFLRQNSKQHAVSFAKKDASVRLTNNDELKRRFDSLTSDLFLRVDDLRNAIKRSNLIVAANPVTVDSFVSHPEAKEYSFISGLAARTGGLIKRGVETSYIETSSREVIDTGRDYVIVAPAGFGKSSFCNRNALYDLQELRDQKSDVVPILVRLHGLVRKSLSSFEAAFLPSADIRELWDTRAQSKRRLRFYLDGLDEVPNESEQAKLMSFASELKAADPTTQVIVTCREHVAGEHLKMFLRLNLAAMDDKRCAEFASRWLADDNEKITKFKAQWQEFPPSRS